MTMNEMDSLIRKFVPPSINEGGSYQPLIDALIPMDKSFVRRFDLYLQNKIDEILPHSSGEEKEDLLVVPDIVLSLQSATIRDKSTDKRITIIDLVVES